MEHGFDFLATRTRSTAFCAAVGFIIAASSEEAVSLLDNQEVPVPDLKTLGCGFLGGLALGAIGNLMACDTSPRSKE